MASATAKPSNSSIAMALAGKSHRVDIPKPREPGSYAAVTAGRSASVPGVDLPTPPASISPSLPPQAYQQHRQALLGVIPPLSPPSNLGVESDIDLQDAVEHARAQDTVSHPTRRIAPTEQPATASASLDTRALAALDSSNAITASMLARDHLPSILLEHGPLAIRYIMGFLTQTVPGFGGIPGAKARRLVVSALEGGSCQEVDFEKVGWGRWDAHKKGERSRTRQTSPGRELSGLPRYDSSRERSEEGREESLERPVSGYPSQQISSLRIPHRPHLNVKRRTTTQLTKSVSPDLAPVPFELETEADRMSLDDEEEERSGRGSSTTNPDDVAVNDDMDEATDEEDWASIGAQALRQSSYSRSHGAGSRMLGARHHYPMTVAPGARRDSSANSHAGVHKRTGGVRTSSLAKSAPNPPAGVGLKTVREDALRGCADDNERQAVAALMSLGAM